MLRKSRQPPVPMDEEIVQPKGGVRIIFATDLHLWPNNPANRQGNYAADMLSKAAQVFAYASARKAQLVIWGGDLTHRPEHGGLVSAVTCRLLNPFLSCMLEYVAQGGKVIFNVGEHDVDGREAGTYIYGPLGMLEMVGDTFVQTDQRRSVVHNVAVGYDDANPNGIFTSQLDINGFPLGIACVPCQPNTEADVEALQRLSDFSDSSIHIIVLHQPIHPGQPPWPHVNPEDLPIYPGQIVLCGHVHETFDPIRTANDGIVLIPGALARRSIDEAARIPTFVEIELGSAIKFRAVTHIPGDELFREPMGETAEEIESARLLLGQQSDPNRLSLRGRLLKSVASEALATKKAALSSYDAAEGGE